MTGFLEITYGPMFAGKTSHLIERIYNYIAFNQIHKNVNPKILIINSSKDNRDINKIQNLTTHNNFKQDTFPNYVSSLKTISLSLLKESDIIKYDYIAIDESQFFDDLETFVHKYLSLDKYIHCCGLIADTEKKPFGSLINLITYADEINHLKAYCKYCKYWDKNAVFTKWISDEKKEDKISIGAEGKYIPVCGKHY